MAEEQNESQSESGVAKASTLFDKTLEFFKKKFLLLAAVIAAITLTLTNLEGLIEKWQGFTVDTDEYVEIILDVSENMNQPLQEGISKWTAAVVTLSDVAEAYDRSNTKAAVRRFGGNCDGRRRVSERVVDFARSNSLRILEALEGIRPCGDADLIGGLSGAVSDFEEADRFSADGELENHIIVVTSGKHTSLSTQNIVVEDLKKRGIAPDFRFVGLKLDEGEMTSLASLVDSLGGDLIPADNLKDLKKAIDLRLPASELAQLFIKKRLAKRLYDNEKDKEAVALFKEVAQRGDDEAMLYLGYIHEDGNSSFYDPKQAAQFYQTAADSGNAAAMFNLAQMYFKGNGVEENADTGCALLAKAESAGHAKASEEHSSHQCPQFADK